MKIRLSLQTEKTKKLQFKVAVERKRKEKSLSLFENANLVTVGVLVEL